MKKLLTLFCVMLFATSSYALENTSTVTMTFVNHSNETLTYIARSGQTQNTFSNPPIIIKSGETATIQGTTSYSEDLVGILFFKDASGFNNVFNVIDYRKIKSGQPVFAFPGNNKKFVSTVISRTFNPDTNGRALTFSAATIEINQK